MPVSRAFAESNRSQTERLRLLVQRLSPAMLAVRLPNGWTVAGALAHVAFWDRQRLCLMRRWAAGDICSGAYDGNLFNDTMQPLLEMIPPERAAAAAVQAAEEVDALLLEVSNGVVEAALARPLIAFFIAVFPANVRADRERLTLRGKPATPLSLRAPTQVLFILLAWWSGIYWSAD